MHLKWDLNSAKHYPFNRFSIFLVTNVKHQHVDILYEDNEMYAFLYVIICLTGFATNQNYVQLKASHYEFLKI